MKNFDINNKNSYTGFFDVKTFKLWNSGIDWCRAKNSGANSDVWNFLEQNLIVACVPLHIIIDCHYTPPYSCDYHTGGLAGKVLRNIIDKSK